MTEPTKAYTLKDDNGWLVPEFKISNNIKSIQDAVGKFVNPSSPMKGWKEAKKAGYRVVKVEIREVEG